MHASRPGSAERAWIEETLVHLKRRAELIAVRGNHDRAFAREFGHLEIESFESWNAGNLLAVHGDQCNFTRPEGHTLVLGHFHPCLGVKDAAGATQKVPLYLANAGCILLPAFSPFARGYDVLCGLPEELAPCFGNTQIDAFAVSTTRVVRLGALHRVIERNFEADVSAPERFRKPPRVAP